MISAVTGSIDAADARRARDAALALSGRVIAPGRAGPWPCPVATVRCAFTSMLLHPALPRLANVHHAAVGVQQRWAHARASARRRGRPVGDRAVVRRRSAAGIGALELAADGCPGRAAARGSGSRRSCRGDRTPGGNSEPTVTLESAGSSSDGDVLLPDQRAVDVERDHTLVPGGGRRSATRPAASR